MGWLRRFFHGRYGYDEFNNALIIILIIINLVSVLTRFIPFVNQIASWLMLPLQFCFLVVIVLRSMSRNISARTRENTAFLSILHRARRALASIKRRDRNFRFFPCPGCRETLRVPKGTGKVLITCPRCGERFQKKA